MAARTTPDLVRGIVSTVPTEVLDPYIDTANQVVSDNCLKSGYTDEKLELIERWLAAHFYACNFRRSSQEGVSGGPNQGFDRIDVDLYFNNTVYGQQALLLDVAGNLAALMNSLKVVKKLLPIQGASIAWLGTDHHHHGHGC